MLIRAACLGLLGAALAVGGCTSLSTSSDVSTASLDEAVLGVPYSLPMLQYELKLTRTLVSCTNGTTKEKLLKFSVAAEAAAHHVPGETYVIDYRKLAGPTKISGVTVLHHEGTKLLKSINATAQDRSAEIIGNVAKSAVGIAALANGIPLPSGARPIGTLPPAATGELICNASAEKLIAALEAATAKAKLSSEALKKATAGVDELANRVSALSDADRATLTKRVTAQQAAARALAGAQGELDEAKQAVTLTTTLRWPRDIAMTGKTLRVHATDLGRLVQLVDLVASSGTRNTKENPCDLALTAAECLGRKLKVHAKLDRLEPEAPAAQKDKGPQRQSVSVDGAKGVFVRPPVLGRLLVCAANEAEECDENGPRVLVRSDDVAIPQLGTLRFLPFENQAFQDNSLVLEVDKSGNIAKFEYKHLKAQGEGASATALNLVNELRGYADARAAQREEEKKAAADKVAADAKALRDGILTGRADELAALQFEIDRLQKQRAFAQLNQPPELSATAGMEAETAIINARIALYRARLTEREAEAALAR